MKRLLILAALLAGLAWYLLDQRHRNYPVEKVTTPSGRAFLAKQLPDEIHNGMRIYRVAYLTKLTDTAALRDEAQALLAWLDPKIRDAPAPHVAGILAIEPGFLRMGTPKRISALSFAQLIPGSWSFVTQEDVTSRMPWVLKGQ